MFFPVVIKKAHQNVLTKWSFLSKKQIFFFYRIVTLAGTYSIYKSVDKRKISSKGNPPYEKQLI